MQRYKKTAVVIAVSVFVLVIVVFVALGSNPSENSLAENNPSEKNLSESMHAGNDTDGHQEQGTESTAADLQEQQSQMIPEGVEIIPVTPAVITDEMVVGVDGPSLDYADENILIFHDYFGLFVYDIQQNKLIGAVDLKAIGCQDTQGDAYCEVHVSKDGQTVYLHPLNITDMYVYRVSEKELTRQKYDVQGLEMFRQIKRTSDCVDPDYTSWRSEGCVALEDYHYLYLESGSGMVEDIHYFVEHNHELVQEARIFD